MNLPKHNENKGTGELGFTILTKIIQKEFKWIIRPNHNETDYGIDAYIDIITEDNKVTGKTIACQVKSGASYFIEKNSVGWIYRDSLSHLNYYLNHDIPVLIILVNLEDEIAYWCHCDANQTSKSKENWKITIPFKQVLNKKSKQNILEFIGPIKDYISQLEYQWRENEFFTNMISITLQVEKEDILTNSYQFIQAAIEKLQENTERVLHFKNKVEIALDGFNDDTRELNQIPEVKNWVKNLFNKTIGLSYFLPKNQPFGFFRVLTLSYMKYKEIPNSDFQLGSRTIYRLELDLTDKTFLNLIFDDLNRFCVKHKLSDELNEELTLEIGHEIVGEIKPSA